MAGTPAPKAIRQKRHQFALAKLAAGMPYSTVITAIAAEWGCSRRQARNVAAAAMGELVSDLETLDVKEMLTNTITRLERIAAKAEAKEQYAAAVGAVRCLHEFAIAPHYAGGQASARHGRSRF